MSAIKSRTKDYTLKKGTFMEGAAHPAAANMIRKSSDPVRYGSPTLTEIAERQAAVAHKLDDLLARIKARK